METKRWEAARMFLLGIGVALLALLAFRPEAGQAQAQQTAGGAANGIIVVGFTGPGQTDSGVVIVDTTLKTMAYYTSRSSQGMRLRSARYFGHDLSIYEMEHTGATGISVDAAAAEANKDARRFR